MRERLLAPLVITAANVLCGLFFLAPGYIRPDSIATFAYVRSAVFDGDFAFFNEWASSGLIRDGLTLFSEVRPAGALANHWWIGTSILSTPSYLVTRAIGGPSDGFGGLYAVVLAWTNVGFAIAALCIAWIFVRRDVTPAIASIALIVTMLGTPLFWQTFRWPLGTHVAGALAIGLVLVALFGDERSSGFATGLAVGLAIAVRIQHFVVIPAVVVVAIRQRRGVRWWIEAVAGGAIPIACQAAAWWSIYGSPFGPLTRGGNLTGTTWMPFHSIALWTILGSSYHGLFTWTPVVILAILGWILSLGSFDDRRQNVAVACLLMFAGEWIANGTFDRYFWGGMSFGARRFTDLAVPFAIGIAWCASALSARIVAIVAAIASLWTVGLMVAAHAGTLSLARYVSGRDLIHAVMSADTWAKAANVPLHAPSLQQSLIAVAIVAVLGLIATRLTPIVSAIAMMLVLVAVIFCGIRTPRHARESAARLHIDLAGSRRFGPLLDQRGLLTDELAWERATGRIEEAARTESELRAINVLLQSISARPSR